MYTVYTVYMYIYTTQYIGYYLDLIQYSIQYLRLLLRLPAPPIDDAEAMQILKVIYLSFTLLYPHASLLFFLTPFSDAHAHFLLLTLNATVTPS